jgi:hypothetical protein
MISDIIFIVRESGMNIIDIMFFVMEKGVNIIAIIFYVMEKGVNIIDIIFYVMEKRGVHHRYHIYCKGNGGEHNHVHTIFHYKQHDID